MPKPAYILSSESGSEDRLTGKFSLFGLVERLQLQRIAPQNGIVVVPSVSLWLTALWMREAGDVGREFEWEFSIHLPAAEVPLVVGTGVFVFDGEFQRIGLRSTGPIGINAPGTLRIICRVRAQGTDEWFSQEFPILVIDATAPSADGQPAVASEGTVQKPE
jgi:hypothetical protein